MHRKIKDVPSLEFFTPEQLEKADEMLHEHKGDDLFMDRRQDDPTPGRTTIETQNGRRIDCLETGKETGYRHLQLTVIADNGAPLPMLEGQTVIFRSPRETYAAYVERQGDCHRTEDPPGCVLLNLRVL